MNETTRLGLFATSLFLAMPLAVHAQPPDYSGTWRFVEESSRVTTEIGFVGLIAAGAPELLHITQAANGTLVVESEINESHARLYVPGAESTTPVYVGQKGKIVMRSRWEGKSLVSEGIREIAAGAADTSLPVKEVFSLASHAPRLTIVVTTTGSDGLISSQLTYERTHRVGPCEAWASPCKPPSP